MKKRRKYTGVIMIADGTKDMSEQIYNIDSIKISHEPVKVFNNFNNTEPMGTATLNIDGINISAEVELYSGVKINHLVPCAGIIIKDIEEVEKDDKIIYNVKDCEIISIGMCFRNVDPRIKPMTEVGDE